MRSSPWSAGLASRSRSRSAAITGDASRGSVSSRALEPTAGGWADEGPPPRSGNAIEILIDGAQALPAIAEALRSAKSHVHLTGWHFSPDFALERDGEPLVLRNLLGELAERVDVRVLVWAGAPLPLFRPSRKDVREMRDRLVGETKIQCALDSKERPMHCHHEKTIVVDDRVAFVGGIDLTSESGDRFDWNHHPSRADVGWHDACARIEGPAVADVGEHFRMRWREVTGETLAAVRSAGGGRGRRVADRADDSRAHLRRRAEG